MSLPGLLVIAFALPFALSFSTALALSAATAASSASSLRAAALLRAFLRLPCSVANHKTNATLMSTDIIMAAFVHGVDSDARSPLESAANPMPAPGGAVVSSRVAPPWMIAAGTSVTSAMGLVMMGGFTMSPTRCWYPAASSPMDLKLDTHTHNPEDDDRQR